MKMRDLIIVLAVGIISFPLMYLTVMFATGGMKVVLNQPLPLLESEPDDVRLMRFDSKMDSAAISQSTTYEAVLREKAELEKEKADLIAQKSRVEMQMHEMDSIRSILVSERSRFEKVVTVSDTAENKRVKDWAKVYSAMRAAEAAKVLESLSEDEAVKIIRSIADERQKAKILSQMSPEKAASISKKMISSMRK